MSDDVSFGSWLKSRRRELDLTQEKLAEGAGCSPDMVRKIEGGQARPSRQLAELLIARLQVRPDEQEEFIRWARGSVAPSPPTSTRSTLSMHVSAPVLATYLIRA